jgi:Helix-turn-helix domain
MKFDWLEQIAFDTNSKNRGDAVRVGIAISKHLNRNTRDAWPGLSHLAELLGTNEKTVRRGIDWLVKQGHLEIRRGGNARADHVLWMAMAELQKSGMPVETILDRLGTSFAGHLANSFGKAKTVEILKQMATLVEQGVFDSITGEGARH